MAQVLENYQRCGLTRLAGESLSEELQESIQAWLVQAGTQTEKVSVAPEHKATQMASVEEDNNAEPKLLPKGSKPRVADSDCVTGPTADISSIQQPTSWSLPVLPIKEREEGLLALDQEVRDCRKCANIVQFRQRTVFGEGPLQPRICFMGEAPGADEDRQGRPFVGRAGQLLTKIIAAMNLKREDVYILNALKCRPPQNRTPSPDEIENCRGFVETQLELLRPDYIVCLGAVAVRSILKSNQSIGRLRGTFHQYRGARVVVTYHPSYLLRNESAKRLVWEDMKMLMREAEL